MAEFVATKSRKPTIRARLKRLFALNPVSTDAATRRQRHTGVGVFFDPRLATNDPQARLAPGLDSWAAFAADGSFRAVVEYDLALTIGTGVYPATTGTGDAATDARIDSLWKAWADAADVTGRPWLDFQRDAALAHALDGEAYVLLTDDGRLQLLMAFQCREIIVDAFGAPTTYVFGDGGAADQSKDASGVLAAIDRANPADIRGTSRYKPALTLTGYEARFSGSELASAIAASRAAFYIYRDATGQAEASDFEAQGDGTTARETTLGEDPVIFDGLNIGEKVEVASMENRPVNWKDFRHSILSTAAMSVGADPSATTGEPLSNYSATRALRTASDRQQEVRFERLCQALWRPIYRWRLRQWAMQGVIAPGAAELAEPNFQFQPLPPIDPGKRASADQTRLESGLASRRQILREQGLPAEQIIRERDADNFNSGNSQNE